jgi:hypothetical protein
MDLPLSAPDLSLTAGISCGVISDLYEIINKASCDASVHFERLLTGSNCLISNAKVPLIKKNETIEYE